MFIPAWILWTFGGLVVAGLLIYGLLWLLAAAMSDGS